MRSFFSIRPGGMSRRSFPSPATSPSCHCRQSHPSSTRGKTSGSSCAATGSPTASSTPTPTFSTTAVSLGTSSSICHRQSCPSAGANGPTGQAQRDLVEHTALAQPREAFPDAVSIPEFGRKRPPGDVVDREIGQGFEKPSVVPPLIAPPRPAGRECIERNRPFLLGHFRQHGQPS